MKVTLNQASDLIATYVKHQIVPFVQGSPGIGKSAIVKAVAKKYGLYLIDIRLAEREPTDLTGFPYIENGRSYFAPSGLFPLKGDTLPQGYNGWLLFLDEISNAPPAVQNIAYKITLDRMIGNHEIHEKVAIIAAGNLATDNANVEEMSSALISRMAVFEAYVDPKEWTDLAAAENIDHRIISYINWKPNNIYTFNPDSAHPVYACPRTWFKVSQLIKDNPTSDKSLNLLGPLISEGIAMEFLAFTEIYSEIPAIAAIFKKPETIDVPKKLDLRWAVLGAVAQHTAEDNLNEALTYIDRFPGELRCVAVRQIIKRLPDLSNHARMQEWYMKFGNEIL